jgi:peptidoglycan/xylan/chitin deacetylase (PgdA/CDA1 family)
VTVFFDLEAPFLWDKKRTKFNLEEVIDNISQLLSKFKIKAVFNTCGVVGEKFPKLIAKLYDEGNEISSHGYAHENFLKITANQLEKVLQKTERILWNITGEKPLGVRSPWLIKNKQIYHIIESRGYSWVSNLYVPFKTTRIRLDLRVMPSYRWIMQKIIYNIKWQFHRKKPFRIGDLLEIPLTSPLDIFCVYPFPDPLKNSPSRSLNEAYEILLKHYNSSKKYFNLNFHPHAIGTCNRIFLLDKILRYLSNQPDVHFILPRQLIELL